MYTVWYLNKLDAFNALMLTLYKKKTYTIKKQIKNRWWHYKKALKNLISLL